MKNLTNTKFVVISTFLLNLLNLFNPSITFAQHVYNSLVPAQNVSFELRTGDKQVLDGKNCKTFDRRYTEFSDGSMIEEHLQCKDKKNNILWMVYGFTSYKNGELKKDEKWFGEDCKYMEKTETYKCYVKSPLRSFSIKFDEKEEVDPFSGVYLNKDD